MKITLRKVESNINLVRRSLGKNQRIQKVEIYALGFMLTMGLLAFMFSIFSGKLSITSVYAKENVNPYIQTEAVFAANRQIEDTINLSETNLIVPPVDPTEYKVEKLAYDVKMSDQKRRKEEEKRKEEERKRRELDHKSAQLQSFIAKYGSPEYAKSARTLITASERCGVDYKLIVAISGMESSFGKYPVGKYNPFGWLNGKTYKSWDDSINDIVCDFGNMYSNTGLHSPEQVASKYLGVDSNYNRWVSVVKSFMTRVP